MNILDCTEIWAYSLRDQFIKLGYYFYFDRTNDNRDKPSLAFNLKSNKIEIDLLIWSSGEGELNILVNKENLTQNYFDDLLDNINLSALLSKVIRTSFQE